MSQRKFDTLRVVKGLAAGMTQAAIASELDLSCSCMSYMMKQELPELQSRDKSERVKRAKDWLERYEAGEITLRPPKPKSKRARPVVKRRKADTLVQKAEICALLAIGYSLHNIGEDVWGASSSYASEFLKKEVPDVFAAPFGPQRRAAAQAWLKSRTIDPAPILERLGVAAHEVQVKSRRSHKCQYFVAETMEICSAHRGYDAYCPEHMKKTAPRGDCIGRSHLAGLV